MFAGTNRHPGDVAVYLAAIRARSGRAGDGDECGDYSDDDYRDGSRDFVATTSALIRMLPTIVD